MRKITLFVIIIWTAIGISVAAISIPTISSDAGKTPAIPQDSVKTTSPENPVDVSNETNQNNNSDKSQIKKQKSKVNPGQNNVKTKDSSKKNNQND